MPMSQAGQHLPLCSGKHHCPLKHRAMGAQVPTHCCAVNTCQAQECHKSTQASGICTTLDLGFPYGEKLQ